VFSHYTLFDTLERLTHFYLSRRQSLEDREAALELRVHTLFDTLERLTQFSLFLGKVLEDREAALELRVHTLLDTLERLTQHSELRQQQSNELIEDLKRANW
jgi:hypothetical protein